MHEELADLFDEICAGSADTSSILCFLKDFLDLIYEQYGTIYVPAKDSETNSQYREFVNHLARLHCVTREQDFLELYLQMLELTNITFVPEHNDSIALSEKVDHLADLASLQQVYVRGNTDFVDACKTYLSSATAAIRQELDLAYREKYDTELHSLCERLKHTDQQTVDASNQSDIL